MLICLVLLLIFISGQSEVVIEVKKPVKKILYGT